MHTLIPSTAPTACQHAASARHSIMPRITALARCCLLALLLALASGSAAAAPCNAWVSGALAFGAVDLLNSSTTDSSGTLTYGCGGQPGDKIAVCIGLGPSPGTSLYDPRRLPTSSGPSTMAFNLYKDAARNTIWGDTGSASYTSLAFSLTMAGGQYYVQNTLPLYGRVKSQGQTGLPTGQYQASWPASIRSEVYTGATPPACTSGGMGENTFNFQIMASVQNDCRIDSISTLDFGTVFQTLSQNVDSTATITVTCNGASYRVSLGNGLHANGQQRRMQGPNSGLLNYGLYKDAARGQVWGSNWNDQLTGTGNGQPQPLTVYGRVPPQTVPGAGIYTDTVVVTVSY